MLPALVLVPALVVPAADEAVLRTLNAQYIQAFLDSDPAWYQAHLAEDFRGILGDGRVLGKGEFVAMAAQPAGVKDCRWEEPLIRVYGDTALVRGMTEYRRADGSLGRTRYTDVYLRRGGAWTVVSAQLTRVQ